MNSRAAMKALPLIALAVVLCAITVTDESVQAASPIGNAVVVPEDISAELALLGAGELVSTGWNRSPECMTTIDCDLVRPGKGCASAQQYPPFGCACIWAGGDYGCHPL